MVKLKILTGSNRPGRFNSQPVAFIEKVAKSVEGVEVEVLDLADINLPFMNEEKPPMMQDYALPHTKAWSAKIAEADAFIMVTPEYNHSTSAVLKNAIDYLFREWNYKPVSFVSYGSLAGGSRAVEHLRAIAAEVKMYDLREQIMLPNYWEHLDSEGKYQFSERHEASAKEMVEALRFWGTQMKVAREALSAA